MQIKFLLSCLAFLIASNFLFAQTKTEFGKISEADLKMEKYDKDPEADAVILQSSCEMNFEVKEGKNYYMKYKVHYRFKVFSKTNSQIADFAVPYFTEGEKIKITGSSYNLVNGKIVETKLTENNIFDEVLDEYVSQKKFTMPEVREGTVFEYTYVYRSKMWYFPQTWYFQESLPVLYSELVFEEPTFLTFKTIFLGFEKLVAETTSQTKRKYSFSFEGTTGAYADTPSEETVDVNINCVRHQWVATHLNAVKNEPYMTAIRDYSMRIDFLLAQTAFQKTPKPFNNTWNDLNTRYMDEPLFGGRLKEREVLRLMASKINPKQDTVEKFEEIRKLVNATVKFNGKYSEFAGRDFKEVLQTKAGSVGEINLMFCTIAQMSGLNVYPALLSTRSRGKLNKDLPQSEMINYVICVLKTSKGWVYADAAADTPVGFLPIECFNDKAWVVYEKCGEWLPITADKSNQTTMYNLDIKANGESTIEVKFGYTGYSAIAFNANKEAYSKSIKEKAEKSVGDEKVEIVKDLQISPIDLGVQVTYALKTKEEMADIVYIPVLEALGYQKNPFELENRKFPVDMPYLTNETIIANITIPEGYVFDEIPPSKSLVLGDKLAKFSYVSSVNGNTLQLMSKLVLNKSYFAPEEYESLRKFFGEVVKKHAEQVVLKKK